MARNRALPVVLLTVGAALAAGSVSLFSGSVGTPATPRPAATVIAPGTTGTTGDAGDAGDAGDTGNTGDHRRGGLGELWTTLDGPAVYSVR
ncbi:hypothetical protein ACFXKW_09470 [Streptomyces sp. NPDC059193]|uniref:hypothetical protein n=1 Tax=Streptomyces sp. NPDC059193 TaxID=3346763 RepID=UPI0036C01F37